MTTRDKLQAITGTYRLGIGSKTYIWRPRLWQVGMALLAGCAGLWMIVSSTVALWG